MKLEISPETFYIVGMVSFSIIGLMSIFNLILGWYLSNIYSKISSLANIIFDFALVLMFNYIKNMSTPQVETEYASDDVNEIITKLRDEKDKKAQKIAKSKK